jgi:SAM-dependent methyltransferase
MKIYSNTERSKLVFLDKGVSASTWTKNWNSHTDWINTVTKKSSNKSRAFSLVDKYTPKHGSIIEGGCGMGQFVYSLTEAGYNTLGIDYAEEIVEKINNELPHLKVKVADLRNITMVSDETFDTYYSGGVIEHFVDGYHDIIREMYRTLKPNGVLILTFPFMSASRKRLVRKLPLVFEDDMSNFYQYALDSHDVISHIKQLGFSLIAIKKRNGIKGFIEVYKWEWIEKIYLNKTQSLTGKVIKRLLGNLLAWIGFGHSIELVFRKN